MFFKQNQLISQLDTAAEAALRGDLPRWTIDGDEKHRAIGDKLHRLWQRHSEVLSDARREKQDLHEEVSRLQRGLEEPCMPPLKPGLIWLTGRPAPVYVIGPWWPATR